ncbi:hypothetical protein SCG7086_AT_00090 [Chlamydiales bacterium SCGC AG-110-P3]|nr:hypothetical protein SCG7086_AT_00090 [Chlamydiales bacterium SCGC AG-110-P3]
MEKKVSNNEISQEDYVKDVNSLRIEANSLENAVDAFSHKIIFSGKRKKRLGVLKDEIKVLHKKTTLHANKTMINWEGKATAAAPKETSPLNDRGVEAFVEDSASSEDQDSASDKPTPTFASTSPERRHSFSGPSIQEEPVAPQAARRSSFSDATGKTEGSVQIPGSEKPSLIGDAVVNNTVSKEDTVSWINKGDLSVLYIIENFNGVLSDFVEQLGPEYCKQITNLKAGRLKKEQVRNFLDMNAANFPNLQELTIHPDLDTIKLYQNASDSSMRSKITHILTNEADAENMEIDFTKFSGFRKQIIVPADQE